MQKDHSHPHNRGVETQAQLRGWYRTPLGNALEVAELEAIREALGTLFGYHLLAVAPPWQASPLDVSRISHRWVMPSTAAAGAAHFLGAAQALPVTTDSLDTIILPHTLEYASHPTRFSAKSTGAWSQKGMC